MPVIQIKIREIAMIKKLILFLFLASAFIGIGDKTHALSTGTTTTGVYYETEIKDNERILDIITFNGFSLSTKWGTITGHAEEYVVNSSGSSSTSDGWVGARGYRGKTICQMELLALSTGTANLRLVGRLGDVGTGCVLWQLTQTTATSTTKVIDQEMDWYRVEYNIDTIGTDSVRSRLKVTDGVR